MTEPESFDDARFYGLVELRDAPEGVFPPERVMDRYLQACPDCNVNLLFRWVPRATPQRREIDIVDVHGQRWWITLAHDATCPWLTTYEKERGDGQAD